MGNKYNSVNFHTGILITILICAFIVEVLRLFHVFETMIISSLMLFVFFLYAVYVVFARKVYFIESDILEKAASLIALSALSIISVKLLAYLLANEPVVFISCMLIIILLVFFRRKLE